MPVAGDAKLNCAPTHSFARLVVRAVACVLFSMIQVTFPDGQVREFPDHSTPLQIAQSIGSRLAKAVLAARVNERPWI